MEIFELFLRFSAIAILAMLVALILRDGRHLQPARFGILVAIGVIAIIVVDLPLSADVRQTRRSLSGGLRDRCLMMSFALVP